MLPMSGYYKEFVRFVLILSIAGRGVKEIISGHGSRGQTGIPIPTGGCMTAGAGLEESRD